ncbi:MAG: arginine--tRNA ligase [Actinomycetota bacterium]
MIEERLSALVREALVAAAPELGLEGEPPPVEITTPKQKAHGDFSTSIALVVAPRVGRESRDVATTIYRHLPADPAVREVSIAGPGFINYSVTSDWLFDTLRHVAVLGPAYGRAEPNGRSVQVEFVSANPTGPLHIGHARNAVIGDAIASVLSAAGWSVEREYYYNDAGRQMELFGASVEARYLELFGMPAEIPEDGYPGEYLIDVAKDIVREHGDAFVALPEDERRAALLREGSRRVLAMIERTLERFGVRFDSFFSERTLHERGEIDEAVRRLREAGFAYDADGAVFFRSTAFGDDKDRVLIRSNGAPTYFAADAAYVVDKFSRGFDHVIYVWGADHHGDVVRVKGVTQALGLDPGAVEMVLYQWVALLRDGLAVGMSKRAGTFVTLDELLDEVGADALRFTLLLRSNDATLEIDIEDMKRRTMENPVYYVQYGHARIASILRNAAERGVEPGAIEAADVTLLSTDPELDLLRRIADLPTRIADAAELRAPHRLTHYAQELAADFHRFYTECRVLTEDEELTRARLWLCVATKQTIANVLGLLGVSAPESMERVDE